MRDASKPLYVEGVGLVRNASVAAAGGGEARRAQAASEASAWHAQS